MDGTKILGILLIVGGLAGLLYGNFSYTKETHEAQFGDFKFTFAEKKEVNIPTWAGLAAVAAGVVLLVVRRK
jgi:uncharacterized membrane protein YdcZ (DUF606 family)